MFHSSKQPIHKFYPKPNSNPIGEVIPSYSKIIYKLNLSIANTNTYSVLGNPFPISLTDHCSKIKITKMKT